MSVVDIVYVAVKLVELFLVTEAVLPFIVIVGSAPVLIASDAVSSMVISSPTFAAASSIELSDDIVTAVNVGAVLSNVIPEPSASFTSAVA